MEKILTLARPDSINMPLSYLWQQLDEYHLSEESELLAQLSALVPPENKPPTHSLAIELIDHVRAQPVKGIVAALLQKYSAGSEGGRLLMGLTEALMRVPDTDTADELIQDKLAAVNWLASACQRQSSIAWAADISLAAANRAVSTSSKTLFGRFRQHFAATAIRKGLLQMSGQLGNHFVFAEELSSSAIVRSADSECYSFDMLGEAAITQRQADDFLQAYLKAVSELARLPISVRKRVTVSVKLSALNPRYEGNQKALIIDDLLVSLKQLIQHARGAGIGITLDAEEASHLELSLQLFEALLSDTEIASWGNLGIAVQAYSRRCLPELAWLAALARKSGTRIPVRLVKGAYWDSEIKYAQQHGLASYPVFTTKAATDIAYLACVRYLLQPGLKPFLFPQFATHNAHTVAAVLTSSGHNDYEFQRLHGMGDILHKHVHERTGKQVRTYCPVGERSVLLPYMVRRLLENGANSSFVYQLANPDYAREKLAEHPLDTYSKNQIAALPQPGDIFLPTRANSAGVDLNQDSVWLRFKDSAESYGGHSWLAAPVINGKLYERGADYKCYTPFDIHKAVGKVVATSDELLEKALATAFEGTACWSATDVQFRLKCLLRVAEKFEQNQAELIALCQREAGKTLQDALDEVREAIDFCRFYAAEAERLWKSPGRHFQRRGVKGVREGLGIFVCISPWNFPLAIFTGQIAAALVSGNTVIAKPASQTALIGALAVRFFLESGIPDTALQFVTANGPQVSAGLLSDKRVSGVAFTGSNETALAINRALLQRNGEVGVLIAETGGQNAMIADSTTLPEQLVMDVMRSAFASAGQRCSSLRVLCLQYEIYDEVVALLRDRLALWRVSSPLQRETDCGPLIDGEAQTRLMAYIKERQQAGDVIAQAKLGDECETGHYITPTLIKIRSVNELTKEHFGPILHLLCYQKCELNKVIDDINQLGFGLTLAIHSRIDSKANEIVKRSRAGNTYINRDQVGAVVGSQPFGGQGLSGTGPKAGGPVYLTRFSKVSFSGG